MIRSTGANTHGQLHRITTAPGPRRADAVLKGHGHTLRGVMDPAAVDALASAITTQEGGPGSLNYRQNNPGNLRYVGQAGAVLGQGGFASFSTFDQGQAALVAQINLDASRGTDAAGKPVTTVSELIASWAPPSENNTSAYLSSVTSQTGFSPDDSLLSLGGGTGGDGSSLAAFSGFDSGAALSADISAGLDAISIPSLPGGSAAVLWGLGGAFALWLASRLF